jgi:hypothetical protein
MQREPSSRKNGSVRSASARQVASPEVTTSSNSSSVKPISRRRARLTRVRLPELLSSTTRLPAARRRRRHSIASG